MTPTSTNTSNPPPPTPNQIHNSSTTPPNLYNRGFSALLCTQFLGALNDNTLKTILSFMVLTGVWAGKLGQGGQGWVALCLTLPFILFSGYAGQISDRISKSRVAIWMKIAEIPIAITAGLGLYYDNLPITIIALIALATQSAFFGPAKYGMIPELVVDRHLSRANGAINMLTNIAVIAGTLLAAPVSAKYFPLTHTQNQTPTRLSWLPLLTMLAIAIAGLIASLFLPKLKAQDPNIKISRNPFQTYIESLRDMANTPVLAIAFGWAYFYLMGMLALLVIFDYQQFLQISYSKASTLFAILAIAVGVGSALAGYLSGDNIKPKLIPFGALGLLVFFLLLGLITPNSVNQNLNIYYWLIAALLAGAGIAAGFYIIPLQALIQELAPANSLGRFLGTTNALSFVFTSFAGLLLIICRNLLHLPPNRIFLVCAALTIPCIIFAFRRQKIMNDALQPPSQPHST